MARYTVQNAASGRSLYVPPPVNKTLATGQRVIVNVPAAEMEASPLVGMVQRGLITVSSAEDPNTAASMEVPTSTQVASDPAGHELLSTLTHDLVASHVTDYEVNGAGLVTRVANWASVLRDLLLRETLLTYDGLDRVATSTDIQYSSGVESYRLTTTFTYAGTSPVITSSVTVRS